MKVFENAWQRDDLPRRIVATIGNFDGVHRGQQELIRQARERAVARGVESVIVTFEPHPVTVLQPHKAPSLLTTPRQKLGLLEASGVDALAIVRFDSAFAQTSAERFVEEFLCGRLGVEEVLVGSRFTFGRGREGTLDYLNERGRELGFVTKGVAEVTHEGEAISSTRIRELVGAGEIERAKEMLGRPFSVIGTVERGEERGRVLGWPTANLAVENELLPSDGVYVTEALVDDDRDGRPSVTNVGTRPTFADSLERHIEAHLLDFEGDLYGHRVELRFCRRLRGERRFGSVEELVEQIGRDAAAAREYFAACAC